MGTPAADAEAEEVVPLRAEVGGTGVVKRLRANSVMALLIGGVAVPVVLGGVVAVATQGGDDERPAPQATRSHVAPTPTPDAPRPRVYPTYGEYVPPRAVATFTTSAPAPSRTKASPTPTSQFSCPPDWWRSPWLRRWCRMQGFDTNAP